jgi:hypothetical protein
MNVRACIAGLSAVALLSIASCAAQQSPPARQPPVGPEPRTVDEAQTDIDRWSAQLGIARTPKGPTMEPVAPGTGPTPPAPSPPPDRPASTQAAPPSAGASSDSAGGGDTSASECVMPCRAIASMRRSVASLCRLTGEDDPRCVAAKKTLEEGERRVARCGC